MVRSAPRALNLARIHSAKLIWFEFRAPNNHILTIFFGFVQRFIGEMKEIVKMLRRVKAGHAAADRQRNGFAFPFYLGRHYFFPYVVGDAESVVFARSDEPQHYLFPAPARREVNVAHRLHNNPANRFQRLVPRLMAIGVVQLFEIINVKNNQTETFDDKQLAPFRMPFERNYLLEKFLHLLRKTVAIVKPGQLVFVGEFFETAHLLFKLLYLAE